MPLSQSGTRDAGPKIPFGRRDHIGCVGKAGLVLEIVEGAPEVVGVAVGEDHLGDAVQVDADGLEVLGKAPGGRLEVRTGAGVDEDEFVADLGERRVRLRDDLGRSLEAVRPVERLDLVRRGLRQGEGAGRRERPVAHHPELDGADPDGCGHRLGGRRQPGERRPALDRRRREAGQNRPAGRARGMCPAMEPIPRRRSIIVARSPHGDPSPHSTFGPWP
jgi:hypothetical protein